MLNVERQIWALCAILNYFLILLFRSFLLIFSNSKDIASAARGVLVCVFFSISSGSFFCLLPPAFSLPFLFLNQTISDVTIYEVTSSIALLGVVEGESNTGSAKSECSSTNTKKETVENNFHLTVFVTVSSLFQSLDVSHKQIPHPFLLHLMI